MEEQRSFTRIEAPFKLDSSYDSNEFLFAIYNHFQESRLGKEIIRYIDLLYEANYEEKELPALTYPSKENTEEDRQARELIRRVIGISNYPDFMSDGEEGYFITIANHAEELRERKTRVLGGSIVEDLEVLDVLFMCKDIALEEFSVFQDTITLAGSGSLIIWVRLPISETMEFIKECEVGIGDDLDANYNEDLIPTTFQLEMSDAQVLEDIERSIQEAKKG
jgi:hypothetical protein